MRSEFQPIPAGYHAIIAAWLEAPEEFLNSTKVQFRVKLPAYMHLYRMVKDGLLEEESMGYRPTKKGWIEFYDYETFYSPLNQAVSPDPEEHRYCPNWR